MSLGTCLLDSAMVSVNSQLVPASPHPSGSILQVMLPWPHTDSYPAGYLYVAYEKEGGETDKASKGKRNRMKLKTKERNLVV